MPYAYIFLLFAGLKNIVSLLILYVPLVSSVPKHTDVNLNWLAGLSLRGCLDFARRINQIDFLGEFQPSLGEFSGLNEPDED